MQSRNIPNYLPQAILVTLFCCLPFGIVAIVQAAKVNAYIKDGNFEGAIQSSDNAKKWCWISFIAGIISFVIFFLIGFFSSY